MYFDTTVFFRALLWAIAITINPSMNKFIVVGGAQRAGVRLLILNCC